MRTDWAQVRELVDEAGRDPSSVSLSVRPHLDPGATMRPVISLAGTSDQMADALGSWAEIGVQHVLVDITAPGGPGGRLEALRRFMTEVVRPS